VVDFAPSAVDNSPYALDTYPNAEASLLLA